MSEIDALHCYLYVVGCVGTVLLLLATAERDSDPPSFVWACFIVISWPALIPVAVVVGGSTWVWRVFTHMRAHR